MKVLVTGGAGSIGSEVVKRLLADGEEVRVIDINEEGLWSLGQEYGQVELFPGDVQYTADVREAMGGCDAVIHCAAMKHVNFCERNPKAAERVNVGGTRKVIQEAGDRRVVLLSTDKACKPTSIMGWTKHKAEQLALHAPNGNVTVFGNVLGSRGSLLPMVIRCDQAGRNIPLTDDRMTRFITTIDEAVGMVRAALHSTEAGRTFSPTLPCSVRILDFLQACRDWIAPTRDIVATGMRPGERIHEWMPAPPPGGDDLICSNDPRFLKARSFILALLDDLNIPVVSCNPKRWLSPY